MTYPQPLTMSPRAELGLLCVPQLAEEDIEDSARPYMKIRVIEPIRGEAAVLSTPRFPQKSYVCVSNG